MKHVDYLGAFVDRYGKEPELESVDVIMLTLDAETFLANCLVSVYREVPVNRLLVCDGGSKDGTVEVLKKFPRVQVFVRPDIRTTGKALEFLISKIETEWFTLVDGDVQLAFGWYDMMRKYQDKYDVLENSRRYMAYHFYRENLRKLKDDDRALDGCHLGRTEAVENFKCEDDFAWGITDILFRQTIEKSGYKYGKIPATYHFHHLAEKVLRKSDEEKNFHLPTFKEPEWIILDKAKYNQMLQKFAKGLVKYVDPNYLLVKDDWSLDEIIVETVSRKWVEKHGFAWLKRYDKGASLKRRSQQKIVELGRKLKIRKQWIPQRMMKSKVLHTILRLKR